VKRWLTFHDAAVELHHKNPEICKEEFARKLAEQFGLQRARSVYYAEDFAVRFCYSADAGFSNCVIALSTLKPIFNTFDRGTVDDQRFSNPASGCANTFSSRSRLARRLEFTDGGRHGHADSANGFVRLTHELAA